MKLIRNAYTLAKIACSKFICLCNCFAKEKMDVIFVRPDKLGDFVLWIDTVKRYREKYPNRKIGLICSVANNEIASKCGLFDKIVAMQMEDKKTYFKLLGNKADLVVLPCTCKASYYGLIVRSICAPQKVMLSSPENDYCNQFPWFLRSFTSIIDVPNMFEGTNVELPEAYRNVLLMNHLTGQSFDKIRLADLSFLIQKTTVDEPYFVLNLGASTGAKFWPIDRFVKVASFLAEKTGWLCVLIGSPNEVPWSERFIEAYSHRYLVMTGKTNLSEMVSLIAGAQIVLCNDTSTVHIAAACRTRCLCNSPRVTYNTFTNYRTGLVDTENEDELPITVCVETCPDCDNRCRENGCYQAETTLPCVLSITAEAICRELATMLDGNR